MAQERKEVMLLNKSLVLNPDDLLDSLDLWKYKWG